MTEFKSQDHQIILFGTNLRRLSVWTPAPSAVSYGVRESCLGLYQVRSWKFTGMKAVQFPRKPLPLLDCIYRFTLHVFWIHIFSPQAYFLSSYPHTLLWRAWLFLIRAFHRCWGFRKILPHPCHLHAERVLLPWPLLTGHVLQQGTFRGLAELAPVGQLLACTGTPKDVAVPRCDLMSAK